MAAFFTGLAIVGLTAWLFTGPGVGSASPSLAHQTGDADATTIQQFAQGESGSAQCGAYQVTWNNTRSFDFHSPGSMALRATASDGSVVVDLAHQLVAGEVVIPLWCGDLLGDGSQALAFESFSGGAHCCFSATVLLLQAGARHVLDADLGNGGLIQPEQIDGAGPLELPASSDVFAYFDDLSFAASPFMPMVFAYDGTQYVEATRQFPERLHAEIDRASADLAEAVARPARAQVPPQFADQEQESVALRLYGLHVLLGDADQALPLIEGRVAPPVATWLAANAPAAADAIAQIYNLAD
jgi:hypothetical protein